MLTPWSWRPAVHHGGGGVAGKAKGMDCASWGFGTRGRSVVSLLQTLPTSSEPLGGGIWEESAGSRGWPRESLKGQDLGAQARGRGV